MATMIATTLPTKLIAALKQTALMINLNAWTDFASRRNGFAVGLNMRAVECQKII